MQTINTPLALGLALALLGPLALDCRQARLAEVLPVHHLILAQGHEFSKRQEVGTVQTVACSNREFQFSDRAVLEGDVTSVIGGADG